MFDLCTLHLFRMCQSIKIVFTFVQNGPNTFGMATLDSAPPPPPPSHDVRVPPNVQVPPSSMVSKAHVEPPPGPPPPDHQPPNAQVPRRRYEYHDGSMNSNEQNARSPPREDPASTNISANKATTSAKFHPETTSSGMPIII